jgi:hypothetical protein
MRRGWYGNFNPWEDTYRHQKAVLRNRIYILRFRFRLLTSYRTVTAPAPDPALYVDDKKQFKNFFLV